MATAVRERPVGVAGSSTRIETCTTGPFDEARRTATACACLGTAAHSVGKASHCAHAATLCCAAPLRSDSVGHARWSTRSCIRLHTFRSRLRVAACLPQARTATAHGTIRFGIEQTACGRYSFYSEPNYGDVYLGNFRWVGCAASGCERCHRAASLTGNTQRTAVQHGNVQRRCPVQAGSVAAPLVPLACLVRW